jgi:hypothetical protein
MAGKKRSCNGVPMLVKFLGKESYLGGRSGEAMAKQNPGRATIPGE